MRLPKGTKRLLSYLLFVFGMQWTKVCALSDDVCDGKFQLKCKNKGCVPESFKCDGEDDCGDNSDETDCNSATPSKAMQCASDQYTCGNGECIKISYHCDGDYDCTDFSDERGCNVTVHKPLKCNSATNFQCKNGRCIPKSYTCDLIDDCGDGSDESSTDGPKCHDETCVGDDVFRCKVTGFCISKYQVCDGHNDCNGIQTDKSDEQNCSAHVCSSDEFKCRNGICISNIWKCNGIDDCGDGSDEQNCTKPTCSQDQFQCKTSALCIPSKSHCNGIKECDDGSDERRCPKEEIISDSTENESNCTFNQFTCPSSKTCISKSWLCDGNSDCPGKEDEAPSLCSVHKCEDNEFQCASGQCLPSSYKCDGVPDCSDQSDEQSCNITRVYSCSDNTYKCHDSDKCIHPLQVCDDKVDCPQGEDEGSKCGVNECLEKNANCSQGCKDLAIGHVCTCEKGFRLSTHDNRTCVDINECKEFGRCTHSCVNYEGSYACTCDEGFTLDRRDRKTCRALAPKPYLLFANDFDIREVSLSGDDYRPILSIWSSIVALGVDTQDQMIYWADSYNKTISRAPISQPKKAEVILDKNIKFPQGLDVDWIGRKIYWTDLALKTISVSNLDGSNRKILVRGGPNEEFRGIAVHPERRYIFWTNWVQSHSKIERANLDGTNRRTIVHHGIVWVSGLAIDYQLDRVYWSDRFHRHISSSTIHGMDIRKIVTKLRKPTGLALFEDKVYWIDSDQKKLSQANKFTGFKRTEYKENLISPMDLVIYHPSAQKQVPNPCSSGNGGCSHLCFGLPLAAHLSTCGCPDNFFLDQDGKTCKEVEFLTTGLLNGGGDATNFVESSEFSRRVIPKAYIIGGVIGMLCIVIIFVTLVVHRRRRNQFGLSMLYETDADFVISNEKGKDNNKNNSSNKSSKQRSSKVAPFVKNPCKLAIVGFDNINFKPFQDSSTGDSIDDLTAVDLVMDECPLDDDRQPIMAQMV